MSIPNTYQLLKGFIMRLIFRIRFRLNPHYFDHFTETVCCHPMLKKHKITYAKKRKKTKA